MVVRPMAFKDIRVDFLCDLHFNLTIGLDDYCKSVGHSRYNSGQLRKTDEIKVGDIVEVLYGNKYKKLYVVLGFYDFNDKSEYMLKVKGYKHSDNTIGWSNEAVKLWKICRTPLWKALNRECK